MLERWANRRYRGAWNNALWSNSSLEKTSRPLKFTTDSNNSTGNSVSVATPRQDWTGSNPSRREGGGCGFTLSRSHSCCAVRLVYIQISHGHIWTTLYIRMFITYNIQIENNASRKWETHHKHHNMDPWNKSEIFIHRTNFFISKLHWKHTCCLWSVPGMLSPCSLGDNA